MFVLMLLCISYGPMADNSTLELELSNTKQVSGLSFSFANGPSEGDSITGLHSLIFSVAGNGTVDSILIEIDDGTSWTTVTNLTSTPWIKSFDSTAYSNGSYVLRATAWDSDANASLTAYSGNFTIANQVPVITIFKALNPDYGSGNSALDRAWFDIGENDAISFRWGASDDDLSRATLANVPGPGSPQPDGPGTLTYGWDWTSGAMSEGTWNPRLTVHDDSGLSASETIFIGIDRTGPSLSSLTIGDGDTWQRTSEVTITGFLNNADDGQGSGVSHAEYSLDGGNTWTTTTSDSVTLTMSEGEYNMTVRAIDNVGNTGSISTHALKVDLTNPEGIGWTVDELTTSRIGPANVSFSAIDDSSGIDSSSSYIQYGFDSNGVGQTPDLSGRWLTLGVNGLSGEVALSNWATKSRQHLMLRAVVIDEAGNEMVTLPTSYQILPGLDIYWNSSQTNLDKLIVRPGEATGNVTLTSVLESNEDFGGSIVVRLESAPADRTADVSWTVMESRTLPTGTLSDSTETLVWNYTVPRAGQYDLRLVIDFANVIDEYDESNNYAHLAVTGASLDAPGLVPSFAPSVLALMFAGLVIAYLQRKPRD